MTSLRTFNSAVGLVIFSTFLMAAMDAGSKYMSGILAIVLITWVRFTIQGVLMALWILRMQGSQGFRVAHPRFQALRGILLVMASVTAVFAMRKMPLAEFTAIIMLSPVLVTAIAGRLLNEPIGFWRWALVVAGFIGTIMVIRPGSGLFGMTALLPLLTMVVLSGYLLVSGRLAVLENPFLTQFYTGLTGSLVLLPFVMLQMNDLSAMLARLSSIDMLVLASIGSMGTVAHLLLIVAFKRAGTAALMPFTYAQIGFAGVIGWIVFGHAPDGWGWAGMAVIAICGTTTAIINGRARKLAVPAAPGLTVS